MFKIQFFFDAFNWWLIGINWRRINFNIHNSLVNFHMQLRALSIPERKILISRFKLQKKLTTTQSQAETERTSKYWSSTTIKKHFHSTQKNTFFPIDFLYALQPVKNKIKNGERIWKKVSVQWDGGVYWECMCVWRWGKKMKILVLSMSHFWYVSTEFPSSWPWPPKKTCLKWCEAGNSFRQKYFLD